MLLLGLLSGCSEGLLEQSGEGVLPSEPSQFILRISQVSGIATTKSIYTDIDAADGAHHLQRIGVIVRQADGAYYGGNDFPLQLFYYNSSGVWEPQGDMLVLDNHQGTVYACSVREHGGANDIFGAKIKSGRPVLEAPILKEQTFTYPADSDLPFCLVDQEDYLYDNNHPTVDRENSEATLNMCHFLSRLSFRVMTADGQPAPNANCYVKRVELAVTGGGDGFIAGDSGNNYTLYLDDGTIADGTHSVTIGFTPDGNYRQSDAYVENGTGLLPKAFGLAAPVRGLTATVSITLGAADSGRFDRTYTSAATTFTWDKGNHYIYLVTLTDVGLEISKPEVASWNEVTLDSRPLQPDGVIP